MGMLDLSKVISYSKAMCVPKSKALCAEYVKKAFEAGGLKYISGNGWSNQRWCQTNDFRCIGDFVPDMRNPRSPARVETDKICNVNGLQFPRMVDGTPYKQMIGDVCLIKHGQYGHICYAMGPGINDWVSDYFQCYPGQMNGTGPYCYKGDIAQVQFWRHNSINDSTPPVIMEQPTQPSDVVSTSGEGGSSNTSSSNDIQPISNINSNSTNKRPGNILGTHLRQQ